MTPGEVYRLLHGVRNVFHGYCCWIRGKDSSIYTRLTLDNGETVQAHRAAYEFFKKVMINPDLYACHHCDVKACINPSHIFIGTPSDNIRDAKRKGIVKDFTVKTEKRKLTFCGDFGHGY